MPADLAPPDLVYSFVALAASDACETLLLAGSAPQMEALYDTHFADFAPGELFEGSPQIKSAAFFLEEASDFRPEAHPLDFFVQHPRLKVRGFYGAGLSEASPALLPFARALIEARARELGVRCLGALPSPGLYAPGWGASSGQFKRGHESLRAWGQALTEKELLRHSASEPAARAARPGL